MSVRVTGITPNCCPKTAKCLNDAPSGWHRTATAPAYVHDIGNGQVILGSSAAQTATVVDSARTIDPRRNFCVTMKAQFVKGAAATELLLGLATPDDVTNERFAIDIDPTTGNFFLVFNGETCSTTYNLGVHDNNSTIYDITICRKINTVVVTINGQVIRVPATGCIPTVRLSPFGSTCSGAGELKILSFCVSYS